MRMRILIFFALLFFGIQGINAQTVIQGSGPSSGGDGGDMRFGAKGGLNISTWLGDGFTGISPRPGAYVGGIAEIPAFMDGFYLQPELLFSFQGADIGPSNVNLFYVHLPIMAKYHITEEIAVEFGPQPGFLISDNWEEEFQGQDTKKFHLGLNLGGGYRLNENLYFQLRFGLGLSKIFDITNSRNGVVSIGACYFL